MVLVCHCDTKKVRVNYCKKHSLRRPSACNKLKDQMVPASGEDAIIQVDPPVEPYL